MTQCALVFPVPSPRPPRPALVRLMAISLVLLPALLFTSAAPSLGGGVTLVTHGYQINPNVFQEWVRSTALAIGARVSPAEASPGVPVYHLCVTSPGPGQPLQADLCATSGLPSAETRSGQILVILDWSRVAGLFKPEEAAETRDPGAADAASTSWVAEAVVPHLLDPAFVPDLAGTPLASFPIHLIGHSRGGSVVSEIARLLAERGVWVDQLTLLDPHPVELLLDAPVAVYDRTVFADNYYQTADWPDGQSVEGAYNRFLTGLHLGGYTGPYAGHSNVHLWYYGTIDTAAGASNGDATITETMRATWWTPSETRGARTGHYFSRIAGGDRFSDATAVPGGASPVHGYAATLGGRGERVALDPVDAVWPNLVTFDLGDAAGRPVAASITALLPGETLGFACRADDRDSGATLTIYLDADRNPQNGNDAGVLATAVIGAASASLQPVALQWTRPGAGGPAAGRYAVRGEIHDGSRTRTLYASAEVLLTDPLPLSADLNHDGIVDHRDLLILMSGWQAADGAAPGGQ